MSMQELYQELLLDHFRNPRYQLSLANPSAKCSLNNPLCGDAVEVMCIEENGVIKEIAFQGAGCAISQASASLLCETLRGQKIEKLREAVKLFEEMILGKADLVKCEALLGDAVIFQTLSTFSARQRCALLAWQALDRCLIDIQK